MTRISRFLRPAPALALLAALLLPLAACRQAGQAPVRAAPAPQERHYALPREATPLPEPRLDASPQAEELRQTILELCSKGSLAQAQVGVLLLDLESGQVLASVNAHTPLLPASNMKLYTTAAALTALGPDYRYQTEIRATGEIRDGVLWGDLVVTGSGDPTISGRFHDGNATAVFHQWAAELKARGIARVQGDLVGDASAMEPHPDLYPGWTLDDISNDYAAQTGALCLNDNCVDLTMVPGEHSGDPAMIATDPPTGYVVVENFSVTSTSRRPRMTVERRPFANVIDVNGGLSRRIREKLVTVTVEDPEEFFVTVLAETLADEGVTLTGRPRVLTGPAAPASGDAAADRGRVLLTHRSPPLIDLAAVTNKESVNLYAEQLLKTLGLEIDDEGSREAGAEAVESWMRSLGVPANEFVMYDGSGLSRLDRVSPAATLTLLRRMYDDPLFPEFLSTLAVGGVDGTLSRRMTDPLLRGQVRAKSGSMRGVHTLSGYVPDADGKLLAFVVMVDGPASGADAKDLHEAVLALAREYHGASSDAALGQEASLPGDPPLSPPLADRPVLR